MTTTSFRRLASVLVAGMLTLVSCQEPTSLVRHTPRPSLDLSSAPELLECPLPIASVGMATIGTAGGTVTAGSSSIHIPPDALLAPTAITIEESASAFVEVRITAGHAEHFEFESPVTVTIGYSRCAPSATASADLGAWYIDDVTKALLEEMDATDDRGSRAVRFETGHLSSYAVAH